MAHHAALRVAHQFNNIDKSIVFCCVSEPSTARGSFLGTLVIFVVDRKRRKTCVCLVIYGMVDMLGAAGRQGRRGGRVGGAAGSAWSAGRQGRRGSRVGRVGGAAGSGGC